MPSRCIVTVTDTGIGMSPEVQARVFEPFFTTKADGRGTGLGLATVHGIVTQAGGEVLLRSAPGQGTCFELRLPTVQAPTGVEGRPGEETAAVARGVILVAEDQDDVRSLVTDVLSQAGYTVIEAANGRFALEHLRKDDGAITLVLSDLVMPEMSGQQLFERAATCLARPRSCSCPATPRKACRAAGPSDPALLTKPFTPEQLLQAVRAALGGHAAIARGDSHAEHRGR